LYIYVSSDVVNSLDRWIATTETVKVCVFMLITWLHVHNVFDLFQAITFARVILQI